MMRSLFSGVSGLKNHQTRMDVIGNNISNVNTTGFKSSRATFSDMLNQTLTGASAPSDKLGGTNPKQVGLGSSVSSIDMLFTDGSVQTTGKNTDLCLSGNALFVVSDGGQKYYTRNGNFAFDAAGNYVQPGNGMYVQGWMAKDGELSTTGEVGLIQIPAGKSMEAAVTKMGAYSNNLNAETKGYQIGNILVNYADGTTETVTNYAPQKRADGISLKLPLGGGFEIVNLDETSSYPFTAGVAIPPTATIYTSVVESVTADGPGKEVNLVLSAGDAVHSITSGGVEGKTYDKIKTLAAGTYKYGDKYTLKGKIQAGPGSVVTNSDEEGKTTLKVDITLPGGGTDTVEIKVPNPKDFMYKPGDNVSFDFTISEITAKDGAIIKTVNGATAPLKNPVPPLKVDSASTTYTRKGNNEVVDSVISSDGDSYTINDKKVASVMVQAKDGSSLPGLVGTKYAAGGTFYPSVVSTITVYDSEGASHDVLLLLTKTEANKWALSLKGGSDSATIRESDGSLTKITLQKKDIVFDTSGRFVSGDGMLDLTYTDRDGNTTAARQKVALNLAGLTQYAGSNTVAAKADGNAAGTLASVAVDQNGIMTGTYTNGVKRVEAQVAVAQFNNAEALTKTGGSLYQESNNSGTPNIKTVTDLGCKITPSALEMSNVDVANEFTDMIVTQRGFQSNSKIITVSDEMLETLINMKR